MGSKGTVVDWKYVTENSSRACLSTGGRCSWPRGKMISGSSGKNYKIALLLISFVNKNFILILAYKMLSEES